MVRGAKGELFPRLEFSDHFTVLNDLLNSIPKDQETLIDIGCGAGELGRVFGHRFFYVGADLPETISNVSKEVNSALRFVPFDVEKDGIGDIGLSSYQVVVMNAFIDVMEKPVEVLRKILDGCRGWVLIHRQTFTDKPTYVRLHSSYGGVSYQSIINRKEFEKVLRLPWATFKEVDRRVIYHGEEPHESILLKYEVR